METIQKKMANKIKDRRNYKRLSENYFHVKDDSTLGKLYKMILIEDHKINKKVPNDMLHKAVNFDQHILWKKNLTNDNRMNTKMYVICNKNQWWNTNSNTKICLPNNET